MAAVEPATVLVGRVHIGRIAHRRGEFAAMRNRALYGALRDFALETAALLTEDSRAGAEVEFDVIDQVGRRGPALYQYKPRTEAFLAERWPRLRELPTCAAAAAELGSGSQLWLRVNGGGAHVSGEQAEPALRAMLERLYEDATSSASPRSASSASTARWSRRSTATRWRAGVVAPLRGVAIEAERVDLGDGLSLVRGEAVDAPAEAVWPENGDGEPAVLCVLERDVTADDGITAGEAERALHPRGQRAAPVGAWADRAGGARLAAYRRGAAGSRFALRRRRRGRERRGLVPAARRGGRPARVLRGDRAGRPAAARGLGARALRARLRASGRRRAV